jgi:hypothetical protein
VDGVIVLVAGTGFALLPYMNPGGELGEPRVRDAVAFLAANDWLAVEEPTGKTRIRLGERARKLLEGGTVGVT